VFSIVSRQSFEMIHQVNDLLLNTLGDAPDVPRVLVGCMKDLAGQRQVTQAVCNFSLSCFSIALMEAALNNVCWRSELCEFDNKRKRKVWQIDGTFRMSNVRAKGGRMWRKSFICS
jgi:hypothetical protein